MKRVILLALVLFLAACSFFPLAAMAGSLEGKTITYLISTKPGGGYDAYGRLVAKYMEKHLPGTTFVPKNMPGAGHRVAAETLYNSPPDGTTIGIFNLNLVYPQIAGKLGDRLDLGRLGWIGKAGLESRVFLVAANSPFRTVEDLKTLGRPIKFSNLAKGGAGHLESTLIGRLFGFQVENIFGFEGDEGALSVMRGEVDVEIGSRSSLQQFVDSGDARFLISYGADEKDDIPKLRDYVKSESDKALLALFESQGRYIRATAGPPGMDPNVLKELRDAYMSALNDPAFLAEAAQQKLPIAPARGEEVAEAIAASLKQSPEIVAEIQQLWVDP